MVELADYSKEDLLKLLEDTDLEKLLELQKSRLSNLKSDIIELDDGDDGLYDDGEFTRILADRQKYASLTEVEQETVRRWAEVEALREHYALFEDFLYDCMTELMGFKCSEVQIDIGRFLQSEVRLAMVQAQRSQAKSTIVAIFAVWQLIHDCKHRVLIISAGSDVATEIANWVIQIIMNWDILECLRPDRQHGDRASNKAFDIHWQLKGAEKSPSVACIGITSNMQGRRADLLIPDDIESSKNGNTELQRAALAHLSKDFTSICQHGRIIYLGTPQTTDSIYNDLPARGYTIRIWPGRYPTEEEEKFYGSQLAPMLRRNMEKDPSLRKGGGLDGTRGKPIDPLLLGESSLVAKELDQGPAYFNLQHMLNTEMSDELRHPLKVKNLVVMDFDIEKGPGEITWLPSPEKRFEVSGYVSKPQFYRPFTISTQLYAYEGKHMYVDTAGGGKNGDETVAVVTYFLHGYVFVAEILALPGGYDEKYFTALSWLAFKHQVNSIEVEKNFGFGAFAVQWRAILMAFYKERGSALSPQVEDVWESGQKELRIIDTLEPIMARHKLIIHSDVITYDQDSTKKYPFDKQESYKLFHQMAKISREKSALLHDDRLDALAGAVRKWISLMAVNEKQRMVDKETDDNIAFFKEWGANIGNNQNGVLGLSSNRFTKITTARKRQ